MSFQKSLTKYNQDSEYFRCEDIIPWATMRGSQVKIIASHNRTHINKTTKNELHIYYLY